MYFARRGTFSDVYFGTAPYVEISFKRFLFEKFVMLNQCVRTKKQLKKEQVELSNLIENGNSSFGVKKELENINKLLK